MTGTPTPNAPTDAFGLAKMVNNAFGKSFKSFQAETMYKPYELGFKWLPHRDGYEKAAALLSPSIRIDSPSRSLMMLTRPRAAGSGRRAGFRQGISSSRSTA